jgi:uncharacterized radical SAM superfamily protein
MLKTMKILLVHPPYFRLFGSCNNRLNVGLHTLCEILNQKGFSAIFQNLDHGDSPLLPRAEILDNSRTPDTGVLEDSANTLLESIGKHAPDAVILSAGDVIIPSLDCGSPDIAETLGKRIRETFPGIFLVVYGPFVRANETFDLTLLGYAESMIAGFLETHVTGFHLPGVTEKELNEVPFLTLDGLDPVPDPNDFDLIWLSRGCPFDCRFCVTPEFCRRRVISRSPRRFVEEIRFRRERFGVRDFYFTDSTFNHSQPALEETCHLLIQEKMDISWRCDCRLDLVDSEQAGLLKEAGCAYVKVGIEAMSEKRLDYLGKTLSVRDIFEKIRLLKQAELGVVAYILLGHPEYSEEEYLEEYRLFESLEADKYTVSIVNPLPGTQLHAELPWAASLFPVTSHLNLKAARFWNIPKRVLEKFYALELSRGREDAGIRRFETRTPPGSLFGNREPGISE